MREPTIELSEEEMALWRVVAGFEFDRVRPTLHEEWKPIGDATMALMRSLLARQAIPGFRWKYFSDPEFDGAGPHRSWQKIFENNHRREEYFDYPNFHKFAIYFVVGPDLTESEKDRFSELMREFLYLDYREAEKAFRAIVRHKVRSGDERDLAEEYYKHALETGRTVRDASRMRQLAKEAARR